MSIFSTELDKLMNAFDMSNEKLGELVGVNRTTVSRWRSGERSPKLEKLPEIASVFNVDTRVFVGEDKISSIVGLLRNKCSKILSNQRFCRSIYTEYPPLFDNISKRLPLFCPFFSDLRNCSLYKPEQTFV